MKTCKRCKGKGELFVKAYALDDLWEECPKCKGTGRVQIVLALPMRQG